MNPERVLRSLASLNTWCGEGGIQKVGIHQKVWKAFQCLTISQQYDFSGSPVAKTELPRQETQVPSLFRELDPTCHD